MNRRSSLRLEHEVRGGFSLIELLISMTLLIVIVGSLMGAVWQVQRGFTYQQARMQAQEAIRVSEYVIGTVLRSAEADPLAAGTSLLDPDPSASGTFNRLRVVSDFNPADGDTNDQLEDVLVYVSNGTLFIRWQAGTSAQAMATPVDSLRFQYFDSSGTELTTAATVALASKVLLTLVAAEDPRSGSTQRRTSWIYFRNR